MTRSDQPSLRRHGRAALALPLLCLALLACSEQEEGSDQFPPNNAGTSVATSAVGSTREVQASTATLESAPDAVCPQQIAGFDSDGDVIQDPDAGVNVGLICLYAARDGVALSIKFRLTPEDTTKVANEIEASGRPVDRRPDLGSTAIFWRGTGTINGCMIEDTYVQIQGLASVDDGADQDTVCAAVEAVYKEFYA